MPEEKSGFGKVTDDVKKSVGKTKEEAARSVERAKEGAKASVDRMKEDVREKLGMKPRDPYMDYGLLVIRLGLAMFMFHGFQKLTGLEGTAGFFANVGIPLAGVMAVVVGMVEFFGGLAMLLGVATRLSGALLTIVMLVAIISVKLKNGWPAFELDLAFLTMALGIALAGPGKFSLREMLTKGKREHILNKL
ncbi:MAG: DoxX family protein [Candidatus Micrarchaeota archaeon]